MSMRIYTMTHKNLHPAGSALCTASCRKGMRGESGIFGGWYGRTDLSAELLLQWADRVLLDLEKLPWCRLCRHLPLQTVSDQRKRTDLYGEGIPGTVKKIRSGHDQKVLLNNSYYDGFLANHNIRALEMTGKVITEKYPEYADAFEQLVNGRQTYFGNILVTSKILFDEYASWLFSIFFEVAERIELETGKMPTIKEYLDLFPNFSCLCGLQWKSCVYMSAKWECLEKRQRPVN